MWSKKERLEAVLNGEKADRVPVSAWRHFLEDEHSGAERFANKMLDFQNTYDWDYIKLQPRASSFCEAWGQKYSYDDYMGSVVAPCIDPLLHGDENLGKELEKIVELTGSEDVFLEQIDAVKQVIAGSEGTPVFHTIFCPGAVFEMFFGQIASGRYRPTSKEGLVRAIQDYPQLTDQAMRNITVSLAKYGEKLVKTGLYGIFYSSAALARTGYLTKKEWERYVRKYDLMLIDALKPAKIWVHTCGINSNPEYFTDYPIDILHWAESATGNVKLDSAKNWIGRITPMGGCDERLFGQNKALEISAMAHNAIERMKDQPFILGPDCSISVNTQEDELKAFRASVED